MNMDVKHLVYLLPERPFKCVYTHTHTHTHTQTHNGIYTNTSTLYTIYKNFKQVKQSLTAEKDISVHGENMAGLVYCSTPSIHDFLEGRGGFISIILLKSQSHPTELDTLFSYTRPGYTMPSSQKL